jgi:hypothetical protein
MGGFLGIGGVNSKQQNQAVGNLNNLYNFGLSTGKNSLSAGANDQGAASSYFQKILSGNRAATLQSVQPETSAVQSGADAQRRQQAAMGTARGGGVASTNQQQKDAVMKQIDDAIFGARPGAATQTAQLGSAETEQGLQATQIAGTATSQAGDIATKARQQAGDEQQGLIKDILGFA